MSIQGWWRKATGSVQRSPAQSVWLSICTQMARWFEEERLRFFSVMIKRMERLSTGADPIEIPIVHRTLGGEAELALTAFQLFIASGDIARHAYITPSDGRNFANLLYGQVCGTHIDDVLRYVQSYREVVNDTTVMHSRVLGDIIRYVTKDIATHVYCLLLLYDDLLALEIMTQIAIASAFDDEKEAKCLIDKGNRFLEKILGEEGSS